jgi:hypothetical protein
MRHVRVVQEKNSKSVVENDNLIFDFSWLGL